jgi:hypothetical protein
MHYTDSIDMDIVMSGSADLVLGDGVHHLCAADSVLVTGVDHAWRGSRGLPDQRHLAGGQIASVSR